MPRITIQGLVNYWLKTAEHDYDTMIGLFKIRRYSDCLFFGHIILEKVLKAIQKIMSKAEVKKIVKKYAETLKKADYDFSAIYLFGSHAKGKACRWSDIDVAVVSKKLKRNYDKNRFLLWDLRMDVDTRIEPHGFTPEDFAERLDPMVAEIRKTGIRVV